VTLPKVIRGKVWKFGANIDTDQIIPAKYAIYSLDEKELGKHAMEGVPGRDTWAAGVTLVARDRAHRDPGRRHLAGHRRLVREDLLPQRDQPRVSDPAVPPGGGSRGRR
jgi:hypothetical protein